MFWPIRFGKMPCFKNIFLAPVHGAKGDSTLQHIPAELQISKWAAGTIGAPREDVHSDTAYLPFLLAPISRSLHKPRSHVCACMKSHGGTFQHKLCRICPLPPATDV